MKPSNEVLSVAALATAAEVATTAVNVHNTVKGGIKDAQDAYNKYVPASLTEYTKPFNIMARMYIERQIAGDDIALPLIGTLNQLYCSFVITALNLNSFVANGRTIRDLLKIVSTEQFVDVVEMTKEAFGNMDTPIASIESSVINLDPDSQRLVSGRVIELDIQLPASTVQDVSTSGGPTTSKTMSVTNSDAEVKYEDKTENKDKRVVTKTTSTVNAKLTLYVQLVPYVIDSDAVGGFLSMNFSPSIKQRWKQYRAGEISFWRDFVASRDLIKKEAKILKADKSNTLLDMMLKSNNALWRWFAGFSGVLDERHNIASSLLITEKKTFVKECSLAGVDFSNQSQRQAFFRKTMVMMVIVVDTMYNNVEMYFNGINTKGEYSYAMINKLSKGKDAFDLKEIMTAFAQGQSPKF